MKKHIFALCAYKESPYLEECILSLRNQSKKCEIIIFTSTPNSFISALAEKYQLQVMVNSGESGITQDWNFAYAHCDAEYVTIAHQDDIYCPEYMAQMLDCLGKAKKPIIFFTDYGELRNGRKVDVNKLLRIKRLMLSPLRLHFFWTSRFVRRRILSLGSPICCPSVTYVKKNCNNPVFRNGFRADEDWEAWENLSKRSGSFVFQNKILMYHRIHEGSETSKILDDNARKEEDYIMFRKFWPGWLAKIIGRIYGTSEKSNQL